MSLSCDQVRMPGLTYSSGLTWSSESGTQRPMSRSCDQVRTPRLTYSSGYCKFLTWSSESGTEQPMSRSCHPVRDLLTYSSGYRKS
jgi:hypothetical protein